MLARAMRLRLANIKWRQAWSDQARFSLTRSCLSSAPFFLRCLSLVVDILVLLLSCMQLFTNPHLVRGLSPSASLRPRIRPLLSVCRCSFKLHPASSSRGAIHQQRRRVHACASAHQDFCFHSVENKRDVVSPLPE